MKNYYKITIIMLILYLLVETKELDRRRVNKAQSANQNKGLNNDAQNACELLIIEVSQNLFRLNQA